MSDDDYETEGSYEVVHIPAPCYSLKALDIVGIGLRTVGSIFVAVGNGICLIATEFNAAAEWARKIDDEERADLDRRVAAIEMEKSLGLREAEGS